MECFGEGQGLGAGAVSCHFNLRRLYSPLETSLSYSGCITRHRSVHTKNIHSASNYMM